MTDLFDRLQATLGEDLYRLERELGGGGMSQVFLATEVELGRNVVVKVLPPDMAAGVNKERFQREIKLAASLQHPHIVPLLTAGSAGDLIWYVMPFIEGESLRVKLAREGEMPLREATALLTEVSDALAYAHRHQVVHRDIKPDNVLLSEGHAVVTDFGVAKAVSASSGGTHSSLTSMGVALGTPAYMSPEQAAADPHVDHRADIYAVGALAYEMLTGRPPFVKQTPQQVLAAQVNETPEPITALRDSVPPDLAGTIMRCLAKRAADRWQTADELKVHFGAVPTPESGGMTPTTTHPYAAVPSGTAGALKTLVDTPLKLAAVYAGAAAFLLLFVYAVVIAFGFPDWVFAGAVALAGIGFPIVFATGRREQKVAEAYTTGLQLATPVGLEKHLTWKRALAGGGLAFSGLAAVAVGFMGMRSAGIGPAATLATSGALGEREPIVLAQLENRSADSSLGSTVTELLRVSLSQSAFVRLVDPARLTESLGRMQREADTPINEAIAIEIAEREGIKAVLSGEVVPLGDGYVISVRLLAADGTVLTAHQASAANTGAVIDAIETVSGDLRERMGESLRTIRRTVPLDLVTTGSLEALRYYTQALQAEIAGDDDRAVDLLDQSIAVDSTFAMAYRKLGIVLSNNFQQRARAVAALTRAFELRDRLTDIERGYTVAMYHARVTGETENTIAAYRTILETYPDDFRSLNNTGVAYGQLQDRERALEFFERALAVDSTWSPGFANVARTLTLVGRYDEAGLTADLMEARFPGNPGVMDLRADLAYRQGDYDATDSIWNALLERERASLGWRSAMSGGLSALNTLRGRLTEARRLGEDALAAALQRGLGSNYLGMAIALANAELEVALDADRARTRRDEALSRFPIEDMPAPDRPYEFLIAHLVGAGDTEGARTHLENMESSGLAQMGRGFQRGFDRAAAWVALADGDNDRALALMRSGSRDRGCASCVLGDLGRVHDRAGNADSAVVYLQRFVDSYFRVVFIDQDYLPTAHRRLGELYEARGDTARAVENYNGLLELWSDADPELQPQVDDLRRRIARLVGEGR